MPVPDYETLLQEVRPGKGEAVCLPCHIVYWMKENGMGYGY